MIAMIIGFKDKGGEAYNYLKIIVIYIDLSKLYGLKKLSEYNKF